MSNNDENLTTPRSREEHMRELVKGLQEADNEIKLYREHMKELKASYVENGYLTKEEVKLTVKAYNQLKGELDLDDVVEYAEIIKEVVNGT